MLMSLDGKFVGRIYLKVVARCLLVQLVYHCVRLKFDQDEEGGVKNHPKEKAYVGIFLILACFLGTWSVSLAEAREPVLPNC